MQTEYEHVHFFPTILPEWWCCPDPGEGDVIGGIGPCKTGLRFEIDDEYCMLSAGQLHDLADFIDQLEKGA